jgi:rod shape-determining protein MreC
MNFLLRYGTFFLFLILEGTALYMVGHYNKAQNEIYQSSANLLTGVVYENFSNIRQYFSMKDIADSLARENANLKTQLEASKYITTLPPFDQIQPRPKMFNNYLPIKLPKLSAILLREMITI